MSKQSFYRQYADYYDTFHSKKDYEGEVKKITLLIRQYKKSKGRKLLDVACGTGRHLSYFRKQYSCAGIDINKPMISVARKKVKGVKFYHSDMTKFSLAQKFDVITCLYASIAYTKTNSLLRKTIKNFAWHLEPGGVLIIEPYWTLTQFRKRKSTNLHMEHFDGKDIKMARVSVSTLKNNLLIREKTTLIAEKSKKTCCFRDRRITGLFEREEILEAMKQASLESKFLKHGLNYDLGLYIGIKI